MAKIVSPITRDEAVALAKKMGNDRSYYDSDIDLLVALGIIEFKPTHEVKVLYNATTVDHGGIGFELWPEGLVVWVGGSIVYKSWEGNKSLQTDAGIEVLEQLTTVIHFHTIEGRHADMRGKVTPSGAVSLFNQLADKGLKIVKAT